MSFNYMKVMLFPVLTAKNVSRGAYPLPSNYHGSAIGIGKKKKKNFYKEPDDEYFKLYGPHSLCQIFFFLKNIIYS